VLGRGACPNFAAQRRLESGRRGRGAGGRALFGAASKAVAVARPVAAAKKAVVAGAGLAADAVDTLPHRALTGAGLASAAAAAAVDALPRRARSG
jgi:hypothetical protein